MSYFATDITAYFVHTANLATEDADDPAQTTVINLLYAQAVTQRMLDSAGITSKCDSIGYLPLSLSDHIDTGYGLYSIRDASNQVLCRHAEIIEIRRFNHWQAGLVVLVVGLREHVMEDLPT